MRARVTRLLLGFALFALAGCFESNELLFSAANADYPFARRTTYMHYTRETGRHQTDWKPSYSGTLTLGDDKVYTEAHRDEGTDSTSRVMFLAIGDGYYVVADISDPSASGRVYYDLLKIDGKTAYRYVLDCASVAKADLISAGISPPNEDGFCTVRTLDGLIATFRSMIDQGSEPGEKYEFAS